MGRTLVQLEKGTIFWTLDKVDENQHMAAHSLGMGEKTLCHRLAAYRLL